MNAKITILIIPNYNVTLFLGGNTVWTLIWASRTFLFFFWPYHAACGILVPQPGIEPRPSSVRPQSLNHWTARKFPQEQFFSPMKHHITEGSLNSERRGWNRWQFSLEQVSVCIFITVYTSGHFFLGL